MLLTMATLPRVASRPTAYVWHLPAQFPPPPLADGIPVDADRVALGRHLFYDQRLSTNEHQSCASCHQQARAFTDGRPHAIGSTGMQHTHNTLSLLNVGYLPTYTWADPSMTTLERQLTIPLFGTHPIELGLTDQSDVVLERFRVDPTYQRLFVAAYGDATTSVRWETIIAALAAFTRTLVSGNAAYDRYLYQGDTHALSVQAQRGMHLFFSNELGCANCHTDIARPGHPQPPRFDLLSFQDTGMPDAGPFRVPPLRNVAVTAPYMHDGSLTTLDAVLRFYEAGGGTGRARSTKNSLVNGFVLSDAERLSVIAFLQSLTDEDALHDPRYSNPFP